MKVSAQTDLHSQVKSRRMFWWAWGILIFTSSCSLIRADRVVLFEGKENAPELSHSEPAETETTGETTKEQNAAESDSEPPAQTPSTGVEKTAIVGSAAVLIWGIWSYYKKTRQVKA